MCHVDIDLVFSQNAFQSWVWKVNYYTEYIHALASVYQRVIQ